MNELRKLTGKKVHNGIKHGTTIADFCEIYSCTEDELKDRIGQIFTQKTVADKIWKEIVANAKKPKPKATISEEVVDTPKVADAVAEVESSDTDPHVPTLDELKASEAELSATVIGLEVDWKALYQQRNDGKKKCQTLFDEIKALKAQCVAKGEEADALAKKDEDLANQMNAIWVRHRAERAALEAIRSQIEEMSKIVLCVYNDHEIAPFDEDVEITLDDTGHDELFVELREREEAEDFRLKDIRVVARLIKIVANLNSPVEILFEDEEIKTAYEVFTKSA